MEYYLIKENYKSAIKMGNKIINKRKVTGALNEEFTKKRVQQIEIAYAQKIQKEIVLAQNEWLSSRNLFKTHQIIFNSIIPLSENYRSLSGPILHKESNLWNQTHRLVASTKPYPAETGYLDNDLNPEPGALIFGYSAGGWALDYNLRSIGANLGSKKSVAAIRLRRWGEETRVRSENLSLWISDDNKLYRRYDGKISFPNEGFAMLLDHLDFSCQYLKIHCDFKDDRYTFAEDFKKIIETYGPPDFSQIK
ncbi:MAG: hypothetical protein ABSH06_00630 [Thermodesulfobacteriota bacterium]